MQIIIDGKEAVLKQGSSFDFIAENRFFSGSDDFTLNISFPLRDCLQNLDIFGHINRSELPIDDFVFDCEIRDRAFHRFGSLTITDITDSDVKAQFLVGRAEQNFSKSFDESYINELPLDNIFSFVPQTVTPEWAWNPTSSGIRAVALPWVSADSGITHNFANFNDSDNSYSWTSAVSDLTWHPYLLYLTERLCNAVGYTYNFNEWRANPWLSRIVVCNSIPATWDIDNYARCLPHWTLAEYFEKLELFLHGEFTIDHRKKKIHFSFSRTVLESIVPVALESVVDEYAASISSDGQDCDYLEAKCFSYKDASHQMWNYMSCPWLLESVPASQIVDRPNLGNIVQDVFAYITGGVPDTSDNLSAACLRQIFHATSTDEYFMLRLAGREYSEAYSRYHNYYVLQPLNEFGPSIANSDSASSEQVDFVPACIDLTESKYGMALFIDFGSYSEGEPESSDSKKSSIQRMVEAGKSSDVAEYFDSIAIAYYDGSYKKGFLPSPLVSNIIIHTENSPSEFVERLGFDLRLNTSNSQLRQPIYNIDRTRKLTFKFLADDIPNPRALFYIHGRRYICEKITATFTEDGMSQLLKGEFWPLLDD